MGVFILNPFYIKRTLTLLKNADIIIMERRLIIVLKRWNEVDRKYLSDNYPKKSRTELAEYFGVSVDSIAYQLRLLGLLKRTRWNEKRDKVLREGYLVFSNKELAKRLKTTPLAVNNRLIRLGLRRNFKWTPEAEKYIMDNYMHKSDREMADDLFTTIDSVSKKLRRMGLVRETISQKESRSNLRFKSE